MRKTMNITHPSIINAIEKSIVKNATKAKCKSKKYEGLDFNIQNFKEIPPAQKKITSMYIDGGNTEIIGNAGFSLQFIRVYWTAFEGTKRIMRHTSEFLAIITIDLVQEQYTAELYAEKKEGIEKIKEIPYKPNTYEDITPEKIANYARRICEIQSAIDSIQHLPKESIICLDGNLCAKYEDEHTLLHELYNQAEKKNISVCAVTKSSGELTDAGTSLIGAIHMLSDSSNCATKSWWYENSITNNNPLHHASIFIVKLHPLSSFAFMLDIAKKQNNKNPSDTEIENIVQTLAMQSKDPTFLGYPYGLIDADKNARCSNKEQKVMNTQMQLLLKNKAIRNMLSPSMAHALLDSLEF